MHDTHMHIKMQRYTPTHEQTHTHKAENTQRNSLNAPRVLQPDLSIGENIYSM